MTDTTKERDLKVAIDCLKHSCLRLNKYQHRATVDIEDVELVLTAIEAERQRADDARKTCDMYRDKFLLADAEIAALKAKLANPVVLGNSDVMSRNFAIKAIYAAGFTVKGFSPEQSVFEGGTTMNKLSIEELKELRGHCINSTVWPVILDELIAIRELKGDQVPVVFDADIIRDANRYRFLRDEDAWGEDSDSWDVETRTGLISSENLMELRLDHFDDAIDARMAASDIPFLNPVTAPQKPVVLPDYRNADFYSHDCTEFDPLGYWIAVKAAIEAAGGSVKDGE